jgi:hypothetical protein
MKTASKKAHFKRLKNYCEGRKKQKESSWFMFPVLVFLSRFPVPVFPSWFARPGFPGANPREEIFRLGFWEEKTKVPGPGLKNGNGKIRVLSSNDVVIEF